LKSRAKSSGIEVKNMFSHIFKYRLKCLLRDRLLVFWTLLYPIVLAVLFNLAFSNIASASAFKSIPVAVVNNAAYQADTAFQGALDSVSDANSQAGQKLFHVTELSQDQAEASLKDNKIKGYILLDGGASVVVKDSGTDQTILKEFVDGYLQARSAYGSILQSNPAASQSFQGPDGASYLKESSSGKPNTDGMLTYYYALIAMAAMFGGFWGNKELTDIQADLSPQAARMNLAPIHKLKAFAYSLSAAVLVQFLSLIVLVAFMNIVLGIDFGAQLPFVLIACLGGSLAGVSLGAVISSIPVKSEGAKVGLLVSISLSLSFLAGLQVASVKYTVTHAFPLIAYINPANLISDAFYALYYYSGYERFFTNIALLFGVSVLFCLVVYFVTRRQRYASL
jgi:ABC-2 type transport system permease protein